MAAASGELSILAIIFVTSVTIAAALGVVWAGFGRARHALSWSLAFVCAGAETLTTAGHALRPDSLAIRWLDLLFMLLAAALVPVGARQRATPQRRKWAPLVAVAPMFAGVAAAQAVPAIAAVGRAAAFFFATAMFALAVRALVPAGRRALPAERLAIASIALFAVLEAVLGGAILLAAAGRDEGGHVLLVVRTVYLIAHPSLSVAAGIAAILLVASDLAERLRTLAVFDPLTGIHNRRGFEEAALRAIAGAQRSRRPLSLALGDIDHFKAINDRLGHAAGDATLRHVAAMLAGGLRGGDVVGRVGGEEFALLLVDSGGPQAAEAIGRLRARIADGFERDDAAPVTMSFGVAELAAGTGTPELLLDDIVARADRALYASKSGGRDRVSLDGAS